MKNQAGVVASDVQVVDAFKQQNNLVDCVVIVGNMEKSFRAPLGPKMKLPLRKIDGGFAVPDRGLNSVDEWLGCIALHRQIGCRTAFGGMAHARQGSGRRGQTYDCIQPECSAANLHAAALLCHLSPMWAPLRRVSLDI